ncbi:MAG: hypothetical protein EOP54_08960 [Sphingobacteriales bacterium]|nr:MAG: hypothetical protein EOP54_08960 [Sphingobacteriales bacterium]
MKNKYIRIGTLLTILMIGGYGVNAQTTSLKLGTNPTIKDPSALIELEANNKGALLPRVALTSTIVASPVTAPANALTVFNTATSGTAPNNVTPGYYYWNLDAVTPANSKWIRLSDSNTPSLGWSLTGNGATNAANNFLGTDNQDVVFKVDNQSKAILPKNTSIGLLSGSAANIDGYLASPSTLMGGAFTSIIRDHSIYNFSATGSAAGFHGAAAGGTIDAPTLPGSSTALLTFVKGSIFDGTTFKAAARMYFRGDGAASATSLPSSISFYTTAAGTTVERERLMIKNNGFVGIGLPTTPMAPTNMLHIYAAANPVRFQGMQTGTIVGATPDDIVVADASGVLKTVPATSLATAAVTADNGLTKTLDNIQLGGQLTKTTTITSNGNPLLFDSQERRIRFDSNGRIGSEAKGTNDGDIYVTSGSGATYNRFDIQAWPTSGEVILTATGAASQLAIATHMTALPSPITFSTSPGGGNVSGVERMRITGTGNVGIANTDPSEKLDVADGNLRVRTINNNIGSSADKVVVADADGVLKTVTAVAPRFFYAPSMVLPTTSTGLPAGVTYDAGTQTFTANLYTIYSNQFGMTGNVAGPTRSAIKSASATTLPVFASTDLEYFVSYFDNAVFDPSTITLSDSGVMTYKVLPVAVITEKTYMNIVFKVK